MTGACLNCAEPMKLPTARWCDGGCRDDWTKRNAASRAARNIVPRDDDLDG